MALSPPDAVRKMLAQRVAQTVPGPSMTPAAVLLLLYPKDGEYCILLNKRSEQVEYHKGEVSFPGGAQDPEDNDLLDTALRETEEEMGINRSDVTVLGELDQVTTRSRFRVQVFVGEIRPSYPFQPSTIEIAEVLEVPISSLRDPANLRVETRWEDGTLVTNYAYTYSEHLIFGATAKILQQFLELLANGLEKGDH
jgi:8-oxo-dGTP pyrophosphatase MutT (NUDIX family)|tara:strand:- start:572 stop:1159 length:588 start_codon:yes stop_codon:yes gene_type:complete